MSHALTKTKAVPITAEISDTMILFPKELRPPVAGLSTRKCSSVNERLYGHAFMKAAKNPAPSSTNMNMFITMQNAVSALSRNLSSIILYDTLRELTVASLAELMNLSATNITSAGIIRSSPTTAPMPKFCWPTTCL